MTERDRDRQLQPDGDPVEDGDGRPVRPIPPGSGARIEREDALRLLAGGELEIVGRLLTASNFTLFARVRRTDEAGSPLESGCVYKPVRGEAPLWDFPEGTLANREVAAYAVSEAAEWDVVPPTILRDGPFGRGMAQLWIDVDPTVDIVGLVRGADPRLRRIALFDAVVNNADRKAGHLLPAADGRIHAVDHGVCFAVEPKLRTVLWAWRGRGLESDEIATLRSLRAALDGELGATLRRLLSPAEVRATARRIDALVAACAFPHPDPERPAVPWPWY